MENDHKNIDISKLLSILKNEEDLIIKPYHSGSKHEIEAIECGKIVSRTNKTLFDYQIGDKINSLTINSITKRRILLINPVTKEIVLELYHNCLPFLFKLTGKQDVRYLSTSPNDIHSIGSIQKRLTFTKTLYDVYNNRHERILSLKLCKNYLRDIIQHRTPEFEILNNDELTNIGRIYPYSTDFQRTEYGHAVAMRIPRDMKVETKATLLITALILKSRLN